MSVEAATVDPHVRCGADAWARTLLVRKSRISPAAAVHQSGHRTNAGVVPSLVQGCQWEVRTVEVPAVPASSEDNCLAVASSRCTSVSRFGAGRREPGPEMQTEPNSRQCTPNTGAETVEVLGGAAGSSTTRLAFGGANRRPLHVTDSTHGQILRATLAAPGLALHAAAGTAR